MIKMKIVIDDKIPYIKGVLEPYAEVVYLSGDKTNAAVVKDADALITRTRTICNEELLASSAVKFIATATIGFDHIDTDYCEKVNIAWTNAPGCNSKSVEQYIASALMVLAEKHQFSLTEKTIGIIGVGNVGAKVARLCETLGMKVLLNDPPRVRAEKLNGFVSLDEILQQSDIISLHVPLNMEGEDITFHLADSNFFSKTKHKPILFNSCRGEIVDTNSLKQALNDGQLSGAVIDCWENEPAIDLELLSLVDLATPHIAGYSRDGKANGTSMSIRALSKFFKLGINNWKCSDVEMPDNLDIFIDGTGKATQEIISDAILATYDIRSDDKKLRGSVETFEKQRGDYPVRREFPTYRIFCKINNIKAINKLKQLGFKL